VSDGQTDLIKLVAPFRSFEKAPKNKNENKRFQRRYTVVFSFPWLRAHLHLTLVSVKFRMIYFLKRSQESVNERGVLRLCVCVCVCLVQFLKHPTGFQDGR
jgi:hypothetical protein